MKTNEMAKALVIHSLRDLVPDWSYRGIEAKWDDDVALRLLDSLNTYFDIETTAEVVTVKPVVVTKNQHQTKYTGRGSRIAQDLINYINLHLQSGSGFVDIRPETFNWSMDLLRERTWRLNKCSFKKRNYPQLHFSTQSFSNFVRVYVNNKGAN